MPDLASIETFVAVTRGGSFASRARELGVDPSSVSRTIAALEADLGVRLFDRTTRRLALTEAGRTYLDRVVAPLTEMSVAADAARDARDEPSGLLRVTASVAFGERWLMPRVASFREDHPRITLDLRLTDALLDIAGEGGIDVALRLGPRIEGALVATKLFDTRYHAVASPAYLEHAGRPTRPSDLARHQGIVFPYPGYRSRWRLRARGSDAAVRGAKSVPSVDEVLPRATLTVSSALAIRRAALNGLGVALLADWTVADDLASGELVDLFPDHEASAADFDTAAWLVYPTRNYVPVRVRAFIDHLKVR